MTKNITEFTLQLGAQQKTDDNLFKEFATNFNRLACELAQIDQKTLVRRPPVSDLSTLKHGRSMQPISKANQSSDDSDSQVIIRFQGSFKDPEAK